MELPRSESAPPCSSSSCSSSSSFASSFSSCFSSNNSTISPSNSPPLSFSSSPTRCEGLDLLVKAVYYVVAGSVVGVPYIQRRVIRRRKRPITFSNLIISGFIKTGIKNPGEEEVVSEENGEIDENLEDMRRTKRRRAAKTALPPKYQDSVLHDWKPPRKRQRGSGKVKAGSGFGL